MSYATRRCTPEAYRSRFKLCTKPWVGQCRGQVGILAAIRRDSSLVWVPAPWGNRHYGGPGHARYYAERIARDPHPLQ